jgi:transcriptional regulator with XRE-family HTH domain
MKISEMIRQALEKKGFKNLKDASKVLGISPELLRVTINKGHIPKDKTLIMIANKLGLDKAMLILAAHQEKVPAEVKGFFLSPSQAKFRRGKRKFPISEEQINYLEKILSMDEILMLRKFRQVSDEARIQIVGYVDYMFSTKRSA